MDSSPPPSPREQVSRQLARIELQLDLLQRGEDAREIVGALRQIVAEIRQGLAELG